MRSTNLIIAHTWKKNFILCIGDMNLETKYVYDLPYLNKYFQMRFFIYCSTERVEKYLNKYLIDK